MEEPVRGRVGVGARRGRPRAAPAAADGLGHENGRDGHHDDVVEPKHQREHGSAGCQPEGIGGMDRCRGGAQSKRDPPEDLE